MFLESYFSKVIVTLLGTAVLLSAILGGAYSLYRVVTFLGN
ncbi:hypothetical protein WDW37_18240 [Bdellovibrionota bacterium FG-1]